MPGKGSVFVVRGWGVLGGEGREKDNGNLT